MTAEPIRVHDELLRYDTVAKWVQRLSPIPPTRDRHLQVLARYCASEGTDPDELIALVQPDREAKLAAMRRLNKWVKTQAPAEIEQHDLQNSVRSFYLANGVNVVTKPYPDVYRRRPGNVPGPDGSDSYQ